MAESNVGEFCKPDVHTKDVRNRLFLHELRQHIGNILMASFVLSERGEKRAALRSAVRVDMVEEGNRIPLIGLTFLDDYNEAHESATLPVHEDGLILLMKMHPCEEYLEGYLMHYEAAETTYHEAA